MTSAVPPSTDTGRRPGQRLRAAREAMGLDVAEVARRLHMPIRVVESLERDDGGRLGGEVFARGQLRSYARLLGVPESEVVDADEAAPIRPVELVPRTYTSPLRRFAEQASRRAVYVVITALIAVPVWMAARPHLGLPAQTGVALDVRTPRPAADAVATPASPAAALPSLGVVREPQPQPPMVASMAPRMQAPATQPTAAALSLSVVEGESWEQVSAPVGRQIEETVLRAGDRREFPAGEVGRVVLGNAGAVEVRHNGALQDLAPHRRANVARFAVSSDGSPTAAD